LYEVLSRFRLLEVAQCLHVHRAGLAREGQEFAAAAEQTADVALKGAGFGAVAAVAGAGRTDAGTTFFRARAGTFPAMQAAAAVAHRGGAARAAGAAGAGAAARGKVGVAAGIAIAQRAGALTLHKVLFVILARARIQSFPLRRRVRGAALGPRLREGDG
jgi:hypothetical protein